MRIVSLIFLILVLSCNSNNKKSAVTDNSQTQLHIDSVRLSHTDGTLLSMEKFAGKTIFLNVWATWCKPCLQEMPSIEKAQNILRNENVVFLLASAESIDEIDDFRKLHPFSFNYVQLQNGEELGIDGLPTTFIFNSNGRLVFSESGYRNWNDKNNIDTILKIMRTNE